MAVCLVALAPAVAGEVFLEEDFEAFEPGPVILHGEGDVNRSWYIFDSVSRNPGFAASAEVVPDPDGGEGLSMRIKAEVRPETDGAFWVGVRRPLKLDLEGLDPSRLRLTARTRVKVRQYDLRDEVILPQQVSYALRLESIKKYRPRGARQFDLLGTSHFVEIGGPLTEAAPGGSIGHFDLRFYQGMGPYQVVFVLSSCCIDPLFQHGNYDVEVYIDDVKLSVVDPEFSRAKPALGPLLARFALDRCRY